MEILRKLAQLAGTDRTAIVYGDGTLSYRTLDHWSDAFAAYLKREAPDGKAPVLIYGHKELEIPACMFGSLKAGRGYVPVDVTYPPERVAQIAAEELGVIAAIIAKESNMESLIKAKGFSDAVVVVGESDVTVVVQSDGLSGADVSKIKEIVMSEASVGAENIVIIEVK